MRPSRQELADANAFVAARHRHHKPVRGHRFSVGVEHNGRLCGVAICGRPVARNVDQRNVLEVLRCCTDGTPNACSYLYGAACRVARELGFRRVQTYLLVTEDGRSLLGAGFVRGHVSAGGSWTRVKRQGRREDQPQCPKVLYYKDLA